MPIIILYSILQWAEAVLSVEISMAKTCWCSWHLSMQVSCVHLWRYLPQSHIILSPQTHSDLIQIKLRFKQVTVTLIPYVHHLFEVYEAEKTGEEETQWERKTKKREYCYDRQLICNAARVFGVCMSNASALHRNTITRAVLSGNAKWDIKHRGELRNTEHSTEPFNKT